MTHDEATARVAELNAAGNGTWFVREAADGSYEPVRVNVPGLRPAGPLKETIESQERPPEPDDPRTSHNRNVGGPWAL